MVNAVRYRMPHSAAPMILRCHPEVKPVEKLTLRLILKRLAQSFRLMVGVRDYGNYLHHMKVYHPYQSVMSEREFHRYCVDARFPSKAGQLGKCPC